MSDSKLPSGVDRVVGKNLRARRRELRLTQEQLAEKLGLTFQQVQKYEKGTNRVSAGRLYEVAAVLDVPITYFYSNAEAFLKDTMAGVREESDLKVPIVDDEALELISTFQKITDPVLRKSLLSTIHAAAEASKETQDGSY